MQGQAWLPGLEATAASLALRQLPQDLSSSSSSAAPCPSPTLDIESHVQFLQLLLNPTLLSPLRLQSSMDSSNAKCPGHAVMAFEISPVKRL